MSDLNDRQREFCRHYADCLNATEAARRAGYSEKTARFIGCENLTKPNIKTEVARLLANRTISREEIHMRLAEHARGDMRDFVRVEKVKDDHGVEHTMVVPDLGAAAIAGKLHLVQSIKMGKFGIEFRLYSAKAALDTLAKVENMVAGGVDDDPDEDEGDIEGENQLTPDDMEVERQLLEAERHAQA